MLAEGFGRDRGYATQSERSQKQRRLQLLQLHQAATDRDAGRVRVTEGGKRFRKTVAGIPPP